MPEEITIEKGGANTAAVESLRAATAPTSRSRSAIQSTSTTSSSKIIGQSSASSDRCSASSHFAAHARWSPTSKHASDQQGPTRRARWPRLVSSVWVLLAGLL